MKKFPTNPKFSLTAAFGKNKKKLTLYYLSLNVVSLGLTFWLWKGMITSSGKENPLNRNSFQYERSIVLIHVCL